MIVYFYFQFCVLHAKAVDSFIIKPSEEDNYLIDPRFFEVLVDPGNIDHSRSFTIGKSEKN